MPRGDYLKKIQKEWNQSERDKRLDRWRKKRRAIKARYSSRRTPITCVETNHSFVSITRACLVLERYLKKRTYPNNLTTALHRGTKAYGYHWILSGRKPGSFRPEREKPLCLGEKVVPSIKEASILLGITRRRMECAIQRGHINGTKVRQLQESTLV